MVPEKIVTSKQSSKQSSTQSSKQLSKASRQGVSFSPSNGNGTNGEHRAEYNDFQPLRVPEQAAIAKRAWEIWNSEGCPEGRAEEHWLRAERELSRLA